MEKLAKRCGFEAVAAHMPEAHAKLLTHIRKEHSRKERRRSQAGSQVRRGRRWAAGGWASAVAWCCVPAGTRSPAPLLGRSPCDAALHTLPALTPCPHARPPSPQMDVDEAEETRSRRSRATSAAARTARRSEWSEGVFSEGEGEAGRGGRLGWEAGQRCSGGA